jgi:peptidoglycan/xylan/chitin deacetylase (PgdA/CDA1 family)
MIHADTTAADQRPVVLLSFDAEEFDLPLEYGRAIPEPEQLGYARQGWQRVVALVDELAMPTTFFTTVRFAESVPSDVRGLHDRHEIASHGWEHTGWDSGGAARSRKRLGELRCAEVTGFRAQRFQALPTAELREAGYSYDSSLNPTWVPGRYCNLRAPRRPFVRDGLVIIPAAVSPRLRVPLFWLGFKHLPLPLYLRFARAALRDTGFLSLVFHPWEYADLPAGIAPRYIVRPSGTVLLARLRRLIERLRPHVRFSTHAMAAEAVRSSTS